ncbi:MAG: hypothetical protein ABL997_08830, partial [Planctomycetota bacterium]
GHTLCGDEVVLAYRLGSGRVLEHFGLERHEGAAIGVRDLEFAPCKDVRSIVVLDAPAEGEVSEAEYNGPNDPDEHFRGYAALHWTPKPSVPAEMAVGWDGWGDLPMGGPSAGDWLDASNKNGASLRFVPGFRRPQIAKKLAEGESDAPQDLLLPRLCDGEAARSEGDAERFVRFEPRNGDARVHADLGAAVDVSRVSVFSWHGGDRAPQKYDLYASDRDVPPALDAADPVQAGWTLLAEVDSGSLGRGGKHGTSVAKEGGLGRYRHLLVVVHSAGALFSEIDVWAGNTKAPCDAAPRGTRTAAVALLAGANANALLRLDGKRIVLDLAPNEEPVRLTLLLGGGSEAHAASFCERIARGGAPRDLSALVQKGNPPRWGSAIATAGQRSNDDDALVVDTIAVPFDNRFGSRMRVCAFDFFSDGRAAITTWNGDVWIVSGLDDDLKNVQWQRFATGLFDPLGLRILGDTVYVHGRDGITRLHDDNRDGEADRYECFNHDECATNAFHEFAFDLQTDPAGNFYLSKGAPVNPGGRGFMTIAPQHGTIFRIGRDGKGLEVVATGLRAPNGIGVSPDGKVVTSGDNEGTYMPRCRLNWIERAGYYAGVVPTAHRNDVPAQPDLPLCWMPMEVDNSSGGQVWVTSDRWDALQGRLLHLSYGTCGLYLVCKEDRDDVVQGGVVRLPLSFSSSAMRARFSPKDGQLYLAGFQGWQTSAAREGGFHRVRFTDKPLRTVTGLRTCDRGVYLTFSGPLDEETAKDPESFGLEVWNYLYSPNYGSPEISVLHPERKVEQGKENRDPLPITGVELSKDRRTVLLLVDGLRPVMQMKVTWNVDGTDGAQWKGAIHASVHALGADPGFPASR